MMPAGNSMVRAWTVSTEHKLQDGVGGEGHLTLAGSKVVVVWGDEVIVYSREGAEEGRWTIDAGAPIDAVGQSNGKLMLGFRDEVALYSLDGFRHGVVIGSDDLPRGFEAYDLAMDEKHKLWAVTDNGWAVKFKRPGVVDWSVRWSERSVDVPKFVVHDGMLYIVAQDRIRAIDALELHTKGDAEE